MEPLVAVARTANKVNGAQDSIIHVEHLPSII